MNLLSRVFLGAFALFVLTPVLSVMNIPHRIVGKISISTANAGMPETQNCAGGGGDCLAK